MSWYRADGDDLLLTLHVQPNARRDEVAGRHGDALKLRVSAPAIEGKANRAVLRLLQRCLALGASRLRIERGETARRKLVRVVGGAADSERLIALLAEKA